MNLVFWDAGEIPNSVLYFHLFEAAGSRIHFHDKESMSLGAEGLRMVG